MKIYKLFLAPVLLCGEIVFGQGGEECCPEERQASCGIQGIYLTGCREEILRDGRPDYTGIQVMDVDIPGGVDCLAKVLEPFLGMPMTKRNVVAIKTCIMNYYVDQGVTMIGIEAPLQKTKGGVVQYLIIKKNFGSPIYCGNSWYDDVKMNRLMGIAPCQDICEEDLKNNIAWFNRNPFRRTNMKFVPGLSRDCVDIEFQTESRPPIRFYLKGDDAGSFNTGYGRIYAGVVNANFMNRGDILNFEYMFSNEFKRVQEYSLNYTSFLPCQHIFNVFANYAKVKPSQSSSGFCGGNIICTRQAQNKRVGKIIEVLPRYTIPFRPFYTCLQQSLIFGFDYKKTNTSVQFIVNSLESFFVTDPFFEPTGTAPIRNNISVSQLVAGYMLSHTICRNSFMCTFLFYGSPFQFLPHQTDSDYNRLRRNSRTKYCYLYGAIGDVFNTCYGSISLLLRGQVASRTLPPTELFTVGGYNTVRGYHESEAGGDNGFIANLELRTLPFCFSSRFKDELILLAFIDYGLSNNWKNLRPGYPHTQWLLGVGPGLRYAINPSFQLRCDYGFKLHHLFSRTAVEKRLHKGFGQLHVGAVFSY
ncbi:MAG: ShlB/FhaC/HecB family hemolysin secretion/activation protein [Verrucomicrobia bacterium]|nr:ShlB/FhaC/HecB family hemolysin secretion/activation protein [Verrucomicrobiota bacterium]